MLRTKNIFLFSISVFLTITILSFPLGPQKTSQNLKSPLIQPSGTSVLGTSMHTDSHIQAPLHILLLGLDGRHGDKNPRCDAIHIFSVDPQAQTLQITSIPRGTPLTYAGLTDTTIVANACHTYGIPYTVAQIEKIAGVKIDYRVQVGFSQTMGILRTLGLPTTSTLQFLRNRHIPAGDYQRSHNQAQFLKDQLISHFDFFMKLPNPAKYLAYKLLTTDMDYDLFTSVSHGLEENGVMKDAANIQLVMKPNNLSNIKEVHLEGHTTDVSLMDDEEYLAYQSELENYIQRLIIKTSDRLANDFFYAHQLVQTPFSQKIWLQVENASKRNQYYFDLLRLYVLSADDRVAEIQKVRDFVTDMQLQNEQPLKEKGESLLWEITS